MNKYAAEKIAQEYYNLGAQLALTKHANFNRGFSSAINGLFGGFAGLTAVPHARDLAHSMLSKYQPFADALTRNATHAEAIKALAKAKALAPSEGILGDTVGSLARGAEDALALSTGDQIIGSLPAVLGLGAGVGLGAGIYKGLGKLDRRLGLY